MGATTGRMNEILLAGGVKIQSELFPKGSGKVRNRLNILNKPGILKKCFSGIFGEFVFNVSYAVLIKICT
jgi:hypothetical protein